MTESDDRRSAGPDYSAPPGTTPPVPNAAPNQPHPNQAYVDQTPPNQPYAGQPAPGQTSPNQPYAGQPESGQPFDPNTPYPGMEPPAPPLPPENVGRGLGLALLAIPIAALLTAGIWRAGFIASISMFVLAALAVIFYRKGSGGAVRKGLPLIIGVILVGIAVSFFAAVATDLATFHGKASPADKAELGTLGQFLGANLFYGPVLKTYAKDLGLFILFAALGTFGVILQLVRNRNR